MKKIREDYYNNENIQRCNILIDKIIEYLKKEKKEVLKIYE